MQRRAAVLAQAGFPSDERVRREASALREAGWELDVFCLREPGQPSREVVDGIRVFRLALGRRRGSRMRYLAEYLLFLAWATLHMLRAGAARRYAVVQVHTLPDFLAFAAEPARWGGARIVLDLHEIAPEFYMEKYGVPASHWAVQMLGLAEQASIRLADRAIAVNDLVLERYVARGAPREKFTIVMNSADERLFPPASGAYVRGSAPARPLALAYHGSLLPYYGLDVAIRAMAQVRERWPYELHLFGDGQGQDGLAALAAQQDLAQSVHFYGRVPQGDLAGHLRTAAAGLVPTRSGPMLDLSLSNKLMELACMGMPVIAAGLPSYRRYLGEEGVLYFTPGDAASLAQVLDRFAAMPDAERARLARRATDAYHRWRWSEQRAGYLRMMEHLAAAAA